MKRAIGLIEAYCDHLLINIRILRIQRSHRKSASNLVCVRLCALMWENDVQKEESNNNNEI